MATDANKIRIMSGMELGTSVAESSRGKFGGNQLQAAAAMAIRGFGKKRNGGREAHALARPLVSVVGTENALTTAAPKNEQSVKSFGSIKSNFSNRKHAFNSEKSLLGNEMAYHSPNIQVGLKHTAAVSFDSKTVKGTKDIVLHKISSPKDEEPRNDASMSIQYHIADEKREGERRSSLRKGLENNESRNLTKKTHANIRLEEISNVPMESIWAVTTDNGAKMQPSMHDSPPKKEAPYIRKEFQSNVTSADNNTEKGRGSAINASQLLHEMSNKEGKETALEENSYGARGTVQASNSVDSGTCKHEPFIVQVPDTNKIAEKGLKPLFKASRFYTTPLEQETRKESEKMPRGSAPSKERQHPTTSKRKHVLEQYEENISNATLPNSRITEKLLKRQRREEKNGKLNGDCFKRKEVQSIYTSPAQEKTRSLMAPCESAQMSPNSVKKHFLGCQTKNISTSAAESQSLPLNLLTSERVIKEAAMFKNRKISLKQNRPSCKFDGCVNYQQYPCHEYRKTHQNFLSLATQEKLEADPQENHGNNFSLSEVKMLATVTATMPQIELRIDAEQVYQITGCSSSQKYWRCGRCRDLNSPKTFRCSTCRSGRPRVVPEGSNHAPSGRHSGGALETALLAKTRHELLNGRDFWICTHCFIGIPSLTAPCGGCSRLVEFVPLSVQEFKIFLSNQK